MPIYGVNGCGAAHPVAVKLVDAEWTRCLGVSRLAVPRDERLPAACIWEAFGTCAGQPWLAREAISSIENPGVPIRVRRGDGTFEELVA
jgi:hypothetical protein